jgi:hypothetical protein
MKLRTASTDDQGRALRAIRPFDRPVVETSVIAFEVVVGSIFRDDEAKVA